MNKTGKILCGLGSATVLIGTIALLVNKEPPKYSSNWIKSLTDTDWEVEREIVRQKFCNPNDYSIPERIRFHNLLGLFDKIKSDRDCAGKIPKGPAFSREHGYNLYKPD